jgi:hypothetical protein
MARGRWGFTSREVLMRHLLFAAFVSTAALIGGCALLAGYDFGSYEQHPEGGGAAGPGGAGGSDPTSSTSGMAGAGGTGGASSTSSTSSSGGGGGGGGGGGSGGGGGLLELYNGPNKPVSLAVDADTVYWTTSEVYMQPDGTVNRRDKDGQNYESIITGLASPSSIEANISGIFWFTVENNVSTIFRKLMPSGMVTPINDLMTETAVGLAVTDQQVFWSASSSGIWRMDADGSNPQPILPGQSSAGALAVDAVGQKVYWLNVGNIQMNDSEIMRADTDGTNAETIAPNQPFPFAIALDAAKVYWATANGGVFSVNKDGSGLFTHVPAMLGNPPASDVAVDAMDIYYTTNTQVRRVPIGSAGSSLVYEAGAGNTPKQIEVDSDAIYFTMTTMDGGSVLKLAK